MSAYNKGSRTVNSLNKYYTHLNLDADPAMKARINAALASSYSKISNITGDEHVKSDIWDIYKYYEDAHGNLYILYKKYNCENPTEEQKLSTLGELWIRLADSPIAFPYMSIIDVDNSSSQISKLDGNIIDICMPEAGTKFVVTGRLLNGSSQICSKPYYITYTMSTICGAGQLAFVAYNPESKYNDQTNLFPMVSSGYKYLGSMNVGSTMMDVVYAKCESDGSLQTPPVIDVGLIV